MMRHTRGIAPIIQKAKMMIEHRQCKVIKFELYESKSFQQQKQLEQQKDSTDLTKFTVRIEK